MKQIQIELNEDLLQNILDNSSHLFTQPTKLISAILRQYLLEDETEINEILKHKAEKEKIINQILKNMNKSK